MAKAVPSSVRASVHLYPSCVFNDILKLRAMLLEILLAMLLAMLRAMLLAILSTFFADRLVFAVLFKVGI